MPRLREYAAIILALHAAFANPSVSQSPFLLQVRTSVGRDASEGIALPPDAAERTMKALDTDGDGSVGPDEIVNFAKMLHIDGSKAASDLKELDADGDGKLNSKELLNVLKASGSPPNSAVPAAKAEPATPAVPRTAAAVQQASAFPPDIAERTMKALDTNGDGSVGPDEITNFASLLHIDGSKAASDLKELDADGDGKLNSKELMKVLQGAKIETAASPSAVPAAEAPRPPAPAVPVAPHAGAATLNAGASPAAEQKAPAVPLAAAQAGVVANAAPPAPPAVVPAPPTSTSVPQASAGPSASVLAGGVPAGPLNPGPTTPEATAPPAAAQAQVAADPSAVQLADLLVSTGSDEEKAMSLEGVAEELNANSTLIARQAMSAAQQAAAQAAQRVAGQIMEQFKALQQQAEQAEIEAARLRAKARIELQSATLATLIAEKALEKPASAKEM